MNDEEMSKELDAIFLRAAIESFGFIVVVWMPIMWVIEHALGY